jgi:hypothetical protein
MCLGRLPESQTASGMSTRQLTAHIHFLSVNIVLTRVYYELPFRNKESSLWHEGRKSANDHDRQDAK